MQIETSDRKRMWPYLQLLLVITLFAWPESQVDRVLAPLHLPMDMFFYYAVVQLLGIHALYGIARK